MTLLRWLTFLLGSQAVILIVLLFWISFFFLLLVFVLPWVSPHWKIVVVENSLNHLRDVPREDTFKIGASAAASEFCEWVQVEIDAYIPHRKY